MKVHLEGEELKARLRGDPVPAPAPAANGADPPPFQSSPDGSPQSPDLEPALPISAKASSSLLDGPDDDEAPDGLSAVSSLLARASLVDSLRLS